MSFTFMDELPDRSSFHLGLGYQTRQRIREKGQEYKVPWVPALPLGLEKLHRGGTQVTVTWYFEEGDEEMQELGEEYQTILEIPFAIMRE